MTGSENSIALSDKARKINKLGKTAYIHQNYRIV